MNIIGNGSTNGFFVSRSAQVMGHGHAGPMIDITLVSGRRPDLLRQTLASFKRWCFDNFPIANVFANIDPFCGTDHDGDLCEELILDFFPNASIMRPSTPSYGQAVKNLWRRIESGHALHLEDDWLLLERLAPDRVFPLFTGQTRMVLLMSSQHNRKRTVRYNVIRKRIPFTPFKRVVQPNFSVSPSFVDGEFARGYADLIDPGRDPEKQNRMNGGNHALNVYVQPYKCAFLASSRKGEKSVVLDIGIDWRERRGIIKEVHEGISTWRRFGEGHDSRRRSHEGSPSS